MKNFDLLDQFSRHINPNTELYRYFWSVRCKLSIHNHFLSQFDKYYEIVNTAMNKWDHVGALPAGNMHILIAYFEALLNNAYSILENIAKITGFFFPKQTLPWGFNDQIKWFLDVENKEVDSEYSDFLKNEINWYPELREMRHEPNHFLSGIVVFDRNQDGSYTPTYFNKKKTQRDSKVFRGHTITSDLKFVHTLGRNISKFLDDFGQHFLSKINPEAETVFLTMSDDPKTKKNKINQTKVKLKDLLSGKVKINEIDPVSLKPKK